MLKSIPMEDPGVTRQSWRPPGDTYIQQLIAGLGAPVDSPAMRDTPARAWQVLQDLTLGYELSPAEILGNALFEEDFSDLVTVRDIEFYSLCEHHLLPFFGHVDICYVPDGRIVGLSKLPRLIDAFSRRFQLQERLTRQIADAIVDIVRPAGVIVQIRAAHLCMMMRGVQKQDTSTVTLATRGVLRHDSTQAVQALSLLQAGQAPGPPHTRLSSNRSAELGILMRTEEGSHE